jgi:hypothetical protein
LTKDQEIGIRILGKGVIIGNRVLLPISAQREKNSQAHPKLAEPGLALREFLATTAGQKLRFCAIYFGKTGLSPSLIAEHFPGTVTDFTACSLPPPSACTFDFLPKSDDVVLSISYTSMFPNHFLFTSPSSRPLFMYGTSPTYQVALAPFHKKGCYRPYLCFYHTSPLVFRTF